MSNKRRVAVYCRVACEDNDAIEKQQTMLRVFAQEQGYSEIAVYSDNGYSGLNFNRPALTQMESDKQAGLINVVIIKDLSRISRNTSDALDWLGRTRQSEVSVKSFNDDVTDTQFTDVRSISGKAYRLHRRHMK